MSNDIRVGLRLLRKDKAFSVTAAVTLALCIGANTALFSVVHNVLLRPLPIPDSDRIVLMGNSYPGLGHAALGDSSVPDYYDRLRAITVFEEQALYNGRNVSVDQNGTPTRVRATQVTPSFFRLVKVQPQLGRVFSEEEGQQGNQRKVVLSRAMWDSVFGGDPHAIGRDLRLDGRPYTVVGVMPRDFQFLDPDVMLWIPLAFTAEQKSDSQRHSNTFQHIGRLKPGATLQQAQAQVDALNAANLDRFPQFKPFLIDARFHTIATNLQEHVVRDVKATLYLMWGGALFVLLIGCVNVANLVLVRSRARVKELATRVALGAARWHIARQLVTESVMLTIVAAVVGLAVGYLALRALGTLNIQELPRGHEIHLDSVVAVYTLGVAAAIGFILGLIPVAAILPANVTAVLREEGRTGTSAVGGRRLRRAFVVAQVAFAFMLLLGAGLLFASFRHVLAVDPGFRPEGVLTVSVTLPRTRYEKDEALLVFTNAALERLRALPGVTAAGATTAIPFGGSRDAGVIFAEGYQMKPGESLIAPNQVYATDGYASAIGATLVRGRWFDERDIPASPKVIVVDQTLANRFWPGQNPVGRRMHTPTDINEIMKINERTVFYTVIGVIRDMKRADLAEASTMVGAYYFAIAQHPVRSLTFALRTNGDPSALAGSVRGVVAQLDRELPVFDTQTMENRMEKSLVSRRSPVLLSLAFGALALLLSAVGIYGVLAYLVTQRTKEIGIRIALGSSGGMIVELVLREGLLLIVSGFVLGAIGAAAVRRTLESQLFGVSATDPVVIAIVAGLLGSVAIIACAVPARRATRIDPIVALAS